MRINNIRPLFQTIAKKVSQNNKLYDKVNNNILPVGETIIATSAYSFFIQNNKNLEDERKPALHYQNIICGAVGIFIASKVNKSIQKHQDEIIKILNKNKTLHRPDKLINGLKIAMPVMIFTSVVRFLIPVLATPISAKINDIRKRMFEYTPDIDKNIKKW